jgi:predicted O-linked N-acetylglucosamine transferase (SPINDLY family)/predicted SAM-dependent methyltransferase
MTVADNLIKAIEFQNQGKLDQAVTLFNAALNIDPGNAHALYSLGLIAMNAGQIPQALALCQRGVDANPGFAPLRYLQGAVFQTMGNKEEALRSFDAALEIQPDYAEVLLNSGALLRSMFRHTQALERFNTILTTQPNHASALGNCGIMLTEFKQSEQAIALFERLMQVKPDYDYAPGLLFYERMHICDWTDFGPLSQHIVDGVQAGKRVCKSLAFMSISDEAKDHLVAAKTFAAHFCPPNPNPLWRGERYTHDKIRLAYVSPDFREHPVGHLMAGVFERHDKSRFETIAISLGVDDQSRLRARMLKSFDKFIDARDMTPAEIAQLMRDMEVDIAVDLGGFTSDTRTDIFARRPAPVQVNYLGYPGSMGTDYYDYILADRHIIPPEHQPFYCEQVAYLPDTYLPTDTSVRISERTPTRAECGLPDEGIVFCSFSHDYKISPPVFDVWMRLLAQVPGSVLWLMSRADIAQRNLRKEATLRGIDPSRLVFAGRVPLVEDHLARYRQADLFLDTHPYNAHTTAADALMAGLPVVTYMGNAFPSRVAGSLLHAIGLPELIADSLPGYEALALSLATDPARLAAIKAQLAANRHTHALFDTDQFCQKLETTLAGLQPSQPDPAMTSSTPTPVAAVTTPVTRRLHLGGKVRSDGWEVLNALPGPNVDHLGNANDLSRFADHSFETVYASHLLEHLDYKEELQRTLLEWRRVLQPGGMVQISVPDLEVLAGLILNKQLTMPDRFMAMRMIFGGHMDAYDYHQVGLTAEFLSGFLLNAGFVDIQRVDRFGHFADTSDMVFAGQKISLNMQARKPL